MATMEQFDYRSEDLFVASANVIDQIFSNPKEAPIYISELWDNTKIGMKTNAYPVPPQSDLDVVCTILFYVVAGTLSLHYHSFYHTKLVDLLLDNIEKHKAICNQEEQKEIIQNICYHAEELKSWINDYEETADWLSDQITEAITTSNTNNKKDDFKPCGTTFMKTALLTDTLIDIICQRLTQANKLDASPGNFRKLFSGINQQFTMTWRGTGGELRDFFKILITNKKYASPQRGYQKILQSHFLNEDGKRFEDLNKAKSIPTFQSVIDDCLFLLQHVTDSMTSIMKRLIQENEHALSEAGYFDPVQAAKQSGLSLRSKRR